MIEMKMAGSRREGSGGVNRGVAVMIEMIEMKMAAVTRGVMVLCS
jgi:hypothetical protein